MMVLFKKSFLRTGKFFIFTGLSKSKVDAKIGRAAFLHPEIKTSPFIYKSHEIRDSVSIN